MEQVGTPFEIYNFPATAFVASFVGTLNVLPGVVVELGRAHGAWLEARLQCGSAHLLARVTVKSAEDLALAPGRLVFALIKSVSLEGHDAGTGPARLSAWEE
jgi:ABC-type Fe3+/spermidine/putrescine transport system ATPase subunit